MTRWLANKMRLVADRLDPSGAARLTGWSFTFEQHRGIVFHERGPGCPVWYMGEKDYARAHDEAEPERRGIGLWQLNR